MKTQTTPASDTAKADSKARTAARSMYKTPCKAEEDKATKLVKTYLTPGENRQFEDNYKNAKIGQALSRSKFIKNRIIAKENGGGTSTKPTVHISTSQVRLMSQIQLNKLDELITELKRIGINYNQSTKRLNQFQLSGEIQKESIVNKHLEGEINQLIGKLNTLYLEIENHLHPEGE